MEKAWAPIGRAMRVVLGLAQEDWAATLEVSRKTVGRWERGDAVPDDAVEARLLLVCAAEGIFERAKRAGVTLGIDGPEALRDALTADRAARRLARTNSGLIGRDAELARVRALLSTERLVTITGPGGVGKTALALAVAGDDTPVVRLDMITDPTQILGSVAAALGVREQAGSSTRQAVVRAVGTHPALLVLDNFEHMLDGAPQVADLLGSCPGLSVLATSRAPLRIGAEVEVRLEPLGNDDAVKLFMDLAPAGAATAVLARDLCSRLDGLPLAIELAAARARWVPVADLLGSVGSVGALGEGRRDGPDRQRTIEASIDWSVALLNDDQRTVLASMAPFVGGFSIAVADHALGRATLADIATLVEHNLVIRDGDRFRMLDTVRTFASGMAEYEVLSRWALAFAERNRDGLRGRDALETSRRVTAEYPNLRAALTRLTDAGDPDAAWLAASLAPFWDAKSMVAEARAHLEMARAAPGSHPAAIATVNGWVGYFAGLQGDLETAERAAGVALTTWETRGSLAGQAYARVVLGHAAAERGRIDDARDHWTRALTMFEEIGDRWGAVRPINGMGELARAAGDLETAERHHRRALELCRELGEEASLPSILSNLIHVLVDLGQPDEAMVLAEESLAVSRRFDHAGHAADGLVARARCHLLAGDRRAGEADLEAAEAIRHRLGQLLEARDRAAVERSLAASST